MAQKHSSHKRSRDSNSSSHRRPTRHKKSYNGNIRIKSEPPDSDVNVTNCNQLQQSYRPSRNSVNKRIKHESNTLHSKEVVSTSSHVKCESLSGCSRSTECCHISDHHVKKEKGEDASRWSDITKNTSSEKKPKELPNLSTTGLLAADTNTCNGVVVKYSEPPDARLPRQRWRFYVFKDGRSVCTLHLHRQSAYLIGRDRKVADLSVDHPSCSKQHAALQFRYVKSTSDRNSTNHEIKPYIIDLESANGTFLNNKPVQPRRYVELFEQDVIKFGYSSREYVLLHDQSVEDEAV